MNILHIGLDWFPECPGGLNRYYYDCTNYFPAANIQFDGLVAGGDTVESNSNSKVKAFAPSEASLIERWLKVRQSFKNLDRRQNYDLIVSHFAFYLFPLLNLVRDRPLVFHFHGPWSLESDVETKRPISIWFKKQIERIVYNRAAKFIVLSQTFHDTLHREYQIPSSKIQIIPGGVDIDRFNINLSPTEARTQLKWDTDRPIIFCIRRLAKRMGLENLIEAMIMVRKHHPDVLLYIAGKGDLEATLLAQIEQLSLEDNVKLIGFVPDTLLPLCYRAANFSVVPTVALEGFGLIVVESLAAGTPVLGTPIGGIPEILNPFSEDLVFEGHQPDQLAEGIIEALSGDRILPTSQACLQYVRENYDWNIITQQIKSVYESVLNQDCRSVSS